MSKDFEQKQIRTRTQSVVLDNRERSTFNGVIDVESFNEEEVVMLTDTSAIILYGKNLHISKLNLEEGQLIVDGFVYAVEYDDGTAGKKGNIFSRLFK